MPIRERGPNKVEKIKPIEKKGPSKHKKRRIFLLFANKKVPRT